MFFTKLWKHNKVICILIALYAIAQVVNNLRQDVAISPIYVYGMYSEKINPRWHYQVPEIFVDDKQLMAKDCSAYQWEMITRPVMLFYKQYEWNNHLYDDYIQRLLHVQNKKNYINTNTEQEFKDWYKTYLENRLHQNIHKVTIKFTDYSFNGKELLAAKNE